MAQKPKSTGPVSPIDSTELTPREIAMSIRHMIQVNLRNAKQGKKRRGLFIWGGPGLGKSALVKQCAKELNFKLIDVRLTQMEPTDLRGIPVPINMDNEHEVMVKWAIPEMFPRMKVDPATGKLNRNAEVIDPLSGHKYDGAVIFLDELPNAAPSVQAGSYQLVLDGALGEWLAPDNCLVVAAGNRETDKGSTFKMPTPLLNRFTHVTIKADYDDWFEYAVNTDLHPDVVGYISAFKAELYQFDPKSASRGFPTPRSWETVSDIVFDDPNLPQQVMLGLIGGTIGDGIAVKFMEYRKNAARLPKASDILDGKVTTMASEETSLMYALTTSMCYELKERSNKMLNGQSKPKPDDKKKFDSYVDNFLGFMMKQFKPELVIMGSRTALSVFKIKFDPNGMKHWDDFSDKYQDLILSAG
jgi:hypothetical protein